MIAMVALLIRARWRSLLVLAALAAIIGSLASVGATYPKVIADRLAAAEVAAAPVGERSIQLAGSSEDSVSELKSQIEELRSIGGFSTTFGSSIQVMGLGTKPVPLVYREGSCAHLRMVAGRCPMTAGEVVIPADTGTDLGVFPGAQLSLAEAKYDEIQRISIPSPEGAHPVEVVGHYQPVDPADEFWGWQSPFTISLRGQLSGPMFTTPGTFAAIPHPEELWTADGIADPAMLASVSWPDLRLRLLAAGLDDRGEELAVLLERVAEKRRYVSVMAPAVLIPVLLLGCVVIFIVSSRRVQHERTELGVQALRGLPLGQRTWLGIGAPGLAILLGGLLGGGVTLAVTGRFGWPALGAVLLVIVAALAAVALSALPVLRARPADALRKVAPRGISRLPVVEVLVAALAGASLLQLRTGDTSGLGVYAAALIAGAVAAASARILPLLTRPLTGWSIRRGRLVLGLAMARLTRAQGGRQLLALTGLTVALISLVASAQDVAGSVRDAQVGLVVGADRVLTVQADSPGAVLAAVRQVDPDGRYALVAGRIDGDVRTPGILALDLSRAGLVDWPGAAELADVLGAGAAEVPLLPPGPLTLDADLTLDPAQRGLPGQPYLRMMVSYPDGGRRTVDFGTLTPGPHAYTAVLSANCATGCRVEGFVLNTGAGVAAEVRLTRLAAGAVTVTGFDTWHRLSAMETTPVWKLGGTDRPSVGWLMPPDAPMKLPSAFTPGLDIEARGMSLAGPDGAMPGVALAETAPVTVLPRLGDRGVLVDYGALSRISGGAPLLDATEIWLTAAAPADVVTRLNATGIRVTGQEVRGAVRAEANRTAAAMILRMHVGATGVALVLLVVTMLFVAGIDRGSPDHQALRLAGVPTRTVRRAMRVGYLAIAVLGALLGLASAAVAWLAARTALPIIDREPWSPPPVLPGTGAVLLPVLASVAVLSIACWLAFARRRTATTSGAPS